MKRSVLVLSVWVAVCAGATLVLPARAQPAYGPDTCAQGYVWREALPGDRVCVTPQTRERTRRDNSLAAQRRQPGGGAYGPETCRQGYVWREARPGDTVCVTPQTRSEAVEDNRRARERRAAAPAPESTPHAAPQPRSDVRPA